MLGFLSFLAFLCAVAFLVSVILLVVRLTKKKPWKPCVVAAVVAVVGVLSLSMPISHLYVPAEKPVDLPPPDTSSAVQSTSNVDNSVETVEKTTTNATDPPVSEQSVVSQTTKPTETLTVSATDPPASEQDVASEATSSLESVSSVSSSVPETELSTTTTSASSSAPSEIEPDLVTIRSLFDLLISEYEGAIVSIEPRTIGGEVVSWSIIDVVVPDSWYLLETFQKERYCQNVGDYVRAAVILGGVAENEAGVAVHFFDVAGLEVAKSKVFGGYKIL